MSNVPQPRGMENELQLCALADGDSNPSYGTGEWARGYSLRHRR